MASLDFMKTLEVSARSSWETYRQVWKFIQFAMVGVGVDLLSYVPNLIYLTYLVGVPNGSLISIALFWPPHWWSRT